ncbi:unnamed protein product, partial [Polarella glacialis]
DAERFAAEHGDNFDFIFGADVLYVDRVAKLLFETAERLLAPNGCFYLGVVERHKHITSELRRAAAEGGWCFDATRGIGKELAHLCPGFRGRKPPPPPGKTDGPKPGMGGKLFEFQQELQATHRQFACGENGA